MKVFVYGTLKRGGRLFLGEHAQNIRPASINGKIYGRGFAFPFADVDAEGVIQGEVHEYDEMLLPTLDRIESMYERRRVTTLEGEEVWVYHYPHIDETFIEIESGVWEN